MFLMNKKCPEKYVDVLYPATSVFLQHTYQRVSARWERVIKNGELECESGAEVGKKEAFLEDSTRLLSRELVHVVCMLLVILDRPDRPARRGADTEPGQDEGSGTAGEWVLMKGAEKEDNAANKHDESMEESVMEDESGAVPGTAEQNGTDGHTDGSKSDKKGFQRSRRGFVDRRKISPFGARLLRDPACRPALVLTVFHTLIWRDTYLFSKVAFVVKPLLAFLVEEGYLDSTSSAHLMSCALNGLRLHGEHEVSVNYLVSLASDTYVALKPKFPEISDVILTVEGVNENTVNEMDQKLLDAEGKPAMSDKFRKTAFRKLVQKAIGLNVGQQYKRNVQVRNLPPLLKPTERKRANQLEDDLDLDILSLFQHN